MLISLSSLVLNYLLTTMALKKDILKVTLIKQE
jgi:hypothetical protein